jgi:hypothetical protein
VPEVAFPLDALHTNIGANANTGGGPTQLGESDNDAEGEDDEEVVTGKSF